MNEGLLEQIQRKFENDEVTAEELDVAELFPEIEATSFCPGTTEGDAFHPSSKREFVRRAAKKPVGSYALMNSGKLKHIR